MGAEDFVSEYSRTFKGEKGEAEAYCYFFKEEGNLASLQKVSRDNTHTHTHKQNLASLQKVSRDNTRTKKQNLASLGKSK